MVWGVVLDVPASFAQSAGGGSSRSGATPSPSSSALVPTDAAWVGDFPEIGDALDCLAFENRLRTQRDRLLNEADSLGFEAELRPAERNRLFREIETLKNGYADLGLDLLLRQEACRTFAEVALSRCREELSRAEGAGTTAKRAWLQAVRNELELALVEPTVTDYPILPSTPGETQETLELKLQYYREATALLESLNDKIEARLQLNRQESAAVEEAMRFVDDLGFVDMGDPSPGGDVRTQVHIPSGADDGPNRPSTRVSVEGLETSLGFALLSDPSDPDARQRWEPLLETRQLQLEDRIAAMAAEMEAIQTQLADDGR